MSKIRRLSFEEAFKVLQMGLQWGCGEKKLCLCCFVIKSKRVFYLGNFDEINPNDLTEEMALDAFKEEVRFIGK